MDAYDILFTLQLLVYFGVFIYKLYNVVYGGEKIEYRATWIYTTAAFLAYGVGFVVAVLGYAELLYLQIFKLQSWTLVMLLMLQVAEIFMSYKMFTPSRSRERFTRTNGRAAGSR